jgi:coenzyme F420-reducing hydrogenase delta subunit
MVNVSAAMGRPLADIITDMVGTIRKLGPNPFAKPRTETKVEISR